MWAFATLALVGQQALAFRGSTNHQSSTEVVASEELLFAWSQSHSGRDEHAHNHAHGHGHNSLRKGQTVSHAKSKMLAESEVGIVHKTEYWGKLEVGTPAQTFTVIFDTGSGNLILPSVNCLSSACQQHKKYDMKQSSSGLQVGKSGTDLKLNPEDKKEATVKFGTGRIHGQFYQDKLCLGSSCMTANFIGTDQETEMPFIQCSFDGIMGLGFKDLSMGEGFNMVDDIVAQHSLPENKFSVYLTDEGGSEINFGGYKRSQAASEVFWVPVNKQSYWQIAIDDVTFDNSKTGLCSGCQVAVDTGTSLLAGPSDVVENLGARLNVKDDCSNFDSLPLLGFAVGNKVLNLKPDDYIDKGADGCSVSLMTLDVPPPKGPLFVFGDPFLRRFLTVYDRDGPSVGFAVAAHEGMTSADASKLLATTGESSSSSSSSSAVSDSAATSSQPSAFSAPAEPVAKTEPAEPVAKPAAEESDPFKAADTEATTDLSRVMDKLGDAPVQAAATKSAASKDDDSHAEAVLDKIDQETSRPIPTKVEAPNPVPASDNWNSWEKALGEDEATNPMKAVDSESFSWSALAAKEENKAPAVTSTTLAPASAETDDRMADHFTERMKRMAEESGDDEKPKPHDTASGLSAVDDAMRMIAKSSAQSSQGFGSKVSEHDNFEAQAESNRHLSDLDSFMNKWGRTGMLQQGIEESSPKLVSISLERTVGKMKVKKNAF